MTRTSGVDWGGNTFVGSAVPFGMVKLGPDMETFDHRPSGFGYSSDGAIVGFSHTHLSGAQGKYGNILVQPITGPVRLGDLASPREREQASPGYYAATLTRYGVRAETLLHPPHRHPSLYLPSLDGCAPDPRYRTLPQSRQQQGLGRPAFCRRGSARRFSA